MQVNTTVGSLTAADIGRQIQVNGWSSILTGMFPTDDPDYPIALRVGNQETWVKLATPCIISRRAE
ncbi:MAG: hypothetical protein ACOYD1_07830 [Candidatus Nanopelagicales bacterium]